ncbi:MAG: hypothetical protein ACLQO1_22225 [Steroidobacteraceae bacterium]
MSKYIVHVGPHKTGSTYIQNGLLLNRQALLEKCVLYPDTFFTDAVSWCHFGLFRMLREQRSAELAARFEELAEQNAELVVLSSEDLSTLNESELTELRNHIGKDVEIVFYMRRWSELLPSSSQEEIRQRGTRTLPEFCVGHVARPYHSDIINFQIKLDRFAHVFGDESIRIISFNNVLENQLDLFGHFVSTFLGIKSTDMAMPTQRHESPPIQHIELLRVLNVMRSLDSNAPPDWPTSRLIANFSKQDLSNIIQSMEKHESFVRLDELAKPLSFIYDGLVERFGRFVLPPYSKDILFKRINKNISYIKPNYLLVEGVIDQLTEIYKTMTGLSQR